MTEAGWTRKKPTVAGWYWWRDDSKSMPHAILVWSASDNTLQAKGGFWTTSQDVARMDGEWLGPITPDSYQQGRAAACEWTYDDMDDYYETACKRGYSLEDGTLEENYHKYCPYCGGLIQLAQQAQDDQLAKGEQ